VEPIELQPEHVGRDLGHLLDGGTAGDAERVGNARALRGLGHDQVGARPDQRRPAHGRDADRRGVTRSEQFDLDRRHGSDGAVAWHDLDGVEGRPVVADADIGAGAGVAVFEREQRHVLGRARAQISRAREQLIEPLEIGTDAGGQMGQFFFSGHVVHGISLVVFAGTIACRRGRDTVSAHSRASGNPALLYYRRSPPWTPAYAGVSGLDQKWLKAARLNLSGWPPARKRTPSPATIVPICVSAISAALAAARRLSALSGGTVQTIS